MKKRLELYARDAKPNQGDLEFSVQVGGSWQTPKKGGLAPNAFYIELDDGAEFTVKATQKKPFDWELEAKLKYDDKGRLRGVGEVPSELELTGSLTTGDEPFLTQIAIAPVRDVTKVFMKRMTDEGYAASWLNAAPAGSHFIADPPVADGKLAAEKSAIDVKDGETVVLFVAGVAAPQIVVVHWPKAVERSFKSADPPFLLFLRPTIITYNQYYLQPYPFSRDYLIYCFRALFNYYDPLKAPGPTAIPFQAKASKKNVVSVVPIPARGTQFQALQAKNGAAWAQSLLQEISRLMFHREIKQRFARVGKVALAGYSYGTTFAREFLVANAKHEFVTDKIKEVYFFDPATADGAVAAKQAKGWMGEASDKRFRLYAHANVARDALAALSLSAGQGEAFLVENDSKTVTVVSVTDEACKTLIRDNADLTEDEKKKMLKKFEPSQEDRNATYNTSHNLIVSTMLTDALRRSDL